jgi:HB1, ASXL, restriction endonuclease HTH domain
MDSYLDVAYQVLKHARRPMPAKAILETAIKAQILPEHLRGKTQHKTLQARLSEDILYNQPATQFFRTEPGIFFLCEFQSDPNIPEKFKERFPARRRTRDLQKEAPLAISRSFLTSWQKNGVKLKFDHLFRAAEDENAVKYLFEIDYEKFATVWTFSLVRRKNSVLSYRVGRYRDDREAFVNKRTIGFSGALTINNHSLFSIEDYGASDSALNVLLLDLDLSPQAFGGDTPSKPEPVCAFETNSDDGKAVLLLIYEWGCPEWFEPTSRRLSLNEPCWLDLTVPTNNLDDFEPWSKAAFSDSLVGVK